MAGLAAANELRDAGVVVTILEARDRIGGRMRTDHSLGIPVDLGAAWIHGPMGNPVKALANQFGIETAQTDFLGKDPTTVQAFVANEEQSGVQAVDQNEFASGQQYANGINEHRFASETLSLDNSLSLADVYNNQPDFKAGLSDAAQAGFDYWSYVRTEYSNAAPVDQLNWQIDQYVKLPGGDELVIGGGYNAISDRLAEGLDIRLETIVSTVAYQADTVTVTTNRGEFTADVCIVTVPLGVLQKGSITFDPALPLEKSSAIQRIGFGNYEKLAMRFHEFHWPRDIQRFNYIWQDKPALYTAWLNLGYYTGEPVIVAYFGAWRAQEFNRLPDADAIETAQNIMCNMFQDWIPKPVAYARSSWAADPFATGSYSFDKVGQQQADRKTLASPVGQTLFFAGEATHPHYVATVHGAYESGIRAAREVLNR